MATMAMDMVRKHKYISIAALLITPSLALANEWAFEPSIKLNSTYTDNVNFSNDDGISSFVNQLGVKVSSEYLTQSTSFNLEAENTAITYSHDNELNDNYIALSSNISFQLWPNGISLFGSAEIQNVPSNRTRNAYADLISGDLVQVKHYRGGVSYNLKNSKYDFQSNLSYNSSESEDGIGEQEGYSANIQSKNGNNSRHAFWDLSSNYYERKNNGFIGKSYQNEIKIGYITPFKIVPFLRYYDEDNSGSVGSSRTTESNSYGAGFRWLATPRLIIDLSYNTPIDDSIENEEQDSYLDVDINWQPTSRTILSAGMSQRFYGDSYNFNLKHKNKRFSNTISYDESIQTFTRDNIDLVNLGLFWCPDTANASIDNCFVSNNDEINQNNYTLQPLFDFTVFEDNNFSLNKRFSWTSSLALSRTTFSFGLSQNTRIDLETDVKSIQKSGNFKVSRKISGYSDLDFSFTYTSTGNAINLPSSRESQYRIYKLDYNRKLNKSLTFIIGLSHLDRASNPTIYVYKENRIKLEIKKVL